MMKWAGKQVYEQMWQPLLIGKFAPFYKDVNMAWMWARMQSPHHSPRNVRRRLSKFADLFAEKLRAMGVEIRLGDEYQVIKQNQASGGLSVDGESFDKVFVTTSPNLMAKLCPDLPENYLKGLLELKSMGAVVMTLVAHSIRSQGGLLLVQCAEGRGLSLPRAGGAHELCFERKFRRRPNRVCGRLFGIGSRIFFDER
jgi:protoporphyrinogen oxidase